SLPSDPTVTSNALAIRIVFPLIGVTPALRWLGLPAMPGKQKKRPRLRGLLHVLTTNSYGIPAFCQREYGQMLLR
ncbi:MAG: hypothetical protein ACI8ZB_002191, partial [Desulforhopalus sp.]